MSELRVTVVMPFFGAKNTNFVTTKFATTMQLDISPDKTMGELQSAFSAAFPGLKIAFFSKPHRAYKGSAAKYLVQKRDMPLRELSPDMKSGYLLVEPETVVWQLERLFEEEYGLHVQVFRKSGRIWLETSVTDDLTLEQQMAKAAASETIQQRFVEPMDYREQE